MEYFRVGPDILEKRKISYSSEIGTPDSPVHSLFTNSVLSRLLEYNTDKHKIFINISI